MNTIRQLTSQALSLALAAAVTLAVLGGVNYLATADHAPGQLFVERAAAPRA
jgi:negative regulator of sigma E activity